jgi:DNA-binding CsgD family transcriptional regulator
VQNWLDKHFFDHCERSDEVVSKFHAIIQDIGVDRCAIIAPLPFHSTASANTRLFAWGFEPAWAKPYREALKKGRDPLPDMIMENGRPVLWIDIFAKHAAALTRNQRVREFFDIHGTNGACIPFFGPHGHQVLASFSLVDPIETISDPRITFIQGLGQVAHCRFIELYREERMPKVPLSLREREVLQQMAIGQSKKEAARYLGLAISSIDTYYRRIFAKLDVRDRIDAVVMGLSLGIIKL